MARTEFFSHAEQFAVTVEPLVDSDRVGATMLSHILAGHLAQPFPETPLLALASDAGRPVLAALRVQPYPLIVVVDPEYNDPGLAVADLAEAIATRHEPIVGVTGRRDTATLFANAWAAHTGSTVQPRLWELYYRLGELVEPVGVPGMPRLASMQDPSDVELLAEWFCAFRQETGVGRTPPVPDPDTLRRNVERGEVYIVWDLHGRVVAVAGHSPVRRGASKIAPVYTPPDERRQGFGSAVTAAAVRSARERGAAEITLFTDADYLPSNVAYRRLGFEVVGEFAELDLLDPPSIST
jgi:GNAT superfamily N-acetyltransferase